MEQSMSELQGRSEALLRGKGYLTASVERRKRFPARGEPACELCGALPMTDIAADLWNVFDLIAIRPKKVELADQWGHGSSEIDMIDMVFVQVTDSTSHSKRRNKIIASAEAKLCLLAGARILIQSWRKVNNRYQAHDEWISLDQFVFGLADTAEQFYEDEKRHKMLTRKLGHALPLSEGLKDSEIPF
jgi:hypothetical protein